MSVAIAMNSASNANMEGRALARRAIIIGLAGLVATAGLAFSVSMASDGIKVANSCAAQCRAKHNQCRINTKGSASCDAQLQACLSRCLGN